MNAPCVGWGLFFSGHVVAAAELVWEDFVPIGQRGPWGGLRGLERGKIVFALGEGWLGGGGLTIFSALLESGRSVLLGGRVGCVAQSVEQLAFNQ